MMNKCVFKMLIPNNSEENRNSGVEHKLTDV